MNIGDEIRIRSTGDFGVIAEIDGDIAYLDMDNGVEMSMFLSDIVLESEYETEAETQTRLTEEETAVKCVAAQEILDALYESTIRLGRLAHINSSAAVSAIGGSSTDWQNLNAYQKMNFIGIGSSTSPDRWIEAFKKNDGSFGKLQVSVLAMFAEQMKG